MAKYDLKFIDFACGDSFITAIESNVNGDQIICSHIEINGYCHHNESEFTIWLDKSTAIKFAKTLRTEINKIKDSDHE